MKKIFATMIANLALTVSVFAQNAGQPTPATPPPVTKPVDLTYTLAPTPLEVLPETPQSQKTISPSSTTNSKNNSEEKGTGKSAGSNINITGQDKKKENE